VSNSQGKKEKANHKNLEQNLRIKDFQVVVVQPI
jgi:hypothetical protein